MPALTAAEIATLRSQIPNTARLEWYLAVAPYGDAVFTAQVNDAGATYGDREIVYDNDTGENDVEAGMTLWVGSSPETYNVGRVRIRSINTGTNTITVAENDDIAWADDLYLSCPGEAGFRELWGVYPRITEAGGVVTFYEDYDLTYVNPTDDVIPPKANAGPPVCAFLGSGGYVDVEFTGDESFTTEVGAAIASYLWDFSDGVVQSGGVSNAGTCTNPNIVRFSSPGFRYVSLTVTDNTAQSRTGTVYVPVWIFDDDEPPLQVQIESQVGNPNWRLIVKAFQTNDTSTDVFYDYPDGALCVLFTVTTYPDGSSDIGGFCHRENIRYMGWLDAESLTFDYDSGTVNFSVISHDLRLKQLPGFAYTLEDDGTPSDWYEVNDLDLDRALHAHLERRTTVNQVCHVETLGESSTRPIAIQPFPDASLYDQAQEHLLKDAMATMMSDRQGVLRVRRDPQFMSLADRNTVAVVGSLTSADILNEIDQSRQHQYELGYVRLGGFSYETPLLSEAPGVAPAQSEASTYTEGFVVVNQAELNLWAGLWFLKENNSYKAVPVEMPGYWPVFDPAFQEYVRLTVTDSLGRNVWTNQRFIVRQVTFGDLMLDGTCRTELVLEIETDILQGGTVTIETPPPVEPPPPPPTPVINPIPEPNFALVHDRARIYSTQDITVLNPVWTNITGAISGTGTILAVECDFYDGIGGWALTATDGLDNNDTGGGVGLWRTNDVTVALPVWTLVFTQAQGEANRWTVWEDCDRGGLTRPTWGQLRSIQPSGPGECVVAEARYHGLTGDLRGKTDFWLVGSGGGFTLLEEGDVLRPDEWSGGEWPGKCGECGPGAPDNPGDYFWEDASYCNQGDLRSCHQIYPPFSGYPCVGSGMYNHMQDSWCVDDTQCAPCFLKQTTPVNPDAANQNYQDGCTHIVRYGGVWWGQAQSSIAGPKGGVYNEIDGEVDSDLWSNYAFCNLTSHFDEYIYWCKQDHAVTQRTNKLVRSGVDTGVTSDLLFGGNGPGYFAGVIGHIRALWDADRTVVLVRKDQPDAGQPNDDVVWYWDAVGGLVNKTGNLTGITWYGVGISLPPVAWNFRYDNVGFSAFNVPLR